MLLTYGIAVLQLKRDHAQMLSLRSEEWFPSHFPSQFIEIPSPSPLVLAI